MRNAVEHFRTERGVVTRIRHDDDDEIRITLRSMDRAGNRICAFVIVSAIVWIGGEVLYAFLSGAIQAAVR